MRIFWITVFIFLLFGFSTFLPAEQKHELHVFYSEHCHACIKVKKEIIPRIEELYGEKVSVVFLEISNPQNLSRLLEIDNLVGAAKPFVPTIVIADKVFIGKDSIEQELLPFLDSFLTMPRRTSFTATSPIDLQEYFKKFSVLTILGAGLIDGVNPCAFTVIVFFISFLTFYGYSKKELVFIGSGYILSVFLSYLLIGLGLFKFLYALSAFYFIIKIFYWCIAGLCFTLSIFSFYDFIKFKKTKNPEESSLRLPVFFKQAIQRFIGKSYRGRSRKANTIILFLGTFAIGAVISLLEAVCTGQVYLPVITFIMRVPELRVKAFFYFFLYNFMFIVPLILVFLCALWGATSEDFSRLMKRYFGTIKVLMGILFLILGGVMVWGV